MAKSCRRITAVFDSHEWCLHGDNRISAGIFPGVSTLRACRCGGRTYPRCYKVNVPVHRQSYPLFLGFSRKVCTVDDAACAFLYDL